MAKNLNLVKNGGKKQNVDFYNDKFKQQFIKGDRLDNQPAFRKYLEDSCIHKSNTNSDFISQGLCHSGDYTLSTSYYKENESFLSDIVDKLGPIKAYAANDTDISKNSRLDIYDNYGNNKTLYFEHSSHVGGIAYHEASGKFFVSNGGRVNIYDEDDIANAKNNSEIKRSDYFDITDEVGQSSYLAVHNNDFYVGKWLKGKNNGKLAKYEINPETGKVNDNPTIYTVPFSDIQGMDIYEKDGKEYFIFSSTDSFAKSELHVAVMKDGKFESVGALEVPVMLEQVSVNKDGKLGMVFESDCKAYDMTANQIGEIVYMDIDKAIDDMEKAKEEYIDRYYKLVDKDRDGEVDYIDKFNKLFNEGESLTDHIGSAKNWASEKLNILLDFDKNGVNEPKQFVNFVGEKLVELTDFNKDGKNEAVEFGKSLTKKVNDLTDFNNNGKSDLIDANTLLKEGLKVTIDNAWEKGQDIVSDIGDGIGKAKDWADDKLKDLKDDFLDLFD